MIRMNEVEESLVKDLLLQNLPVITYNTDNEIEFNKLNEYNEYLCKFKYYPYPTPEPTEVIEKMRCRGLSEYIHDPYHIQERLKLAKRNDRFRHLPALAIGIDEHGKLHFYQKGLGHKIKNIRLTGVFRIPARSRVVTELNNIYHVYSPFNNVSKNGIYDKNYSLKTIGWLLENGETSDKLLEVFKFMIKGVLITSNITPDYIVTIKSSKPINQSIISKFTSDEYFKNTKIIEIEKPTTEEVLQEYKSGAYPESETLSSASNTDKLKMRKMSPLDRKIYALVVKNLLSESNNIKEVKNKSMIFIDDLVTTGNTLSKILIPLYEEDNKIIPFTFLIK